MHFYKRRLNYLVFNSRISLQNQDEERYNCVLLSPAAHFFADTR